MVNAPLRLESGGTGMHKTLLGIVAVATATAGQAAVEIDFNTVTGNLGTSETYTSGSLTVTAYGYDDENDATDLYGKSDGGDEEGLGLATDPSGQNEIYYAGDGFETVPFISLDVSALLGQVSGAQVFFGSTTQGEVWYILGSDTAGVLGDLLDGGTSEGAWIDLLNWGDYDYYQFVSGGTQVGGQISRGNVLLGGISLTQSVPEPGTWGMMLLGFGAIGFAFRRRSATSLPQAA
jgi:hypothetical protein